MRSEEFHRWNRFRIRNGAPRSVFFLLPLIFLPSGSAFAPPVPRPRHSATSRLLAAADPPLPEFDDTESEEYLRARDAEREREEAERLLAEARKLRAAASDIEDDIPPRPFVAGAPPDAAPGAGRFDWEGGSGGHPLRGKRVLVTGANGRLGSMVCRYLLRECPGCEVIAAVHYVGEATTRGYGRLSYEVGAEDGVGSIGAAWSEDRTATYQYDPETMGGYNLQNLRVVDIELLDPVECTAVTKDVDAVVWCATDFNANKPRAISGLNFAFLFRAVAAPTKGRVEIEGLRNILEGLRESKLARRFAAARRGEVLAPAGTEEGLTSVVLASAAEDALADFVTPLGDFRALKREGEAMLREEFRELSHCVLQMYRYDENEEGLDGQFEEVVAGDDIARGGVPTVEKMRRKINRRDAARFCADTITDSEQRGKTLEVWTVTK